MKNAPFSSYPYCFALGQLGQPGQSPETRMNRAFRVSILHKLTGTRLGQGGTLRNQDIAGQATRAKTAGRAVSRLGFRRVRFGCNSGGSQARPSVPAGPLVGVVRQGCEGFATPQPIGMRGIGSAGDNLPAGDRQAAAAVSQLGTFTTAPPVVASAFRRLNGGQPGGFVRVPAGGRHCFRLSHLGKRRGLVGCPG